MHGISRIVRGASVGRGRRASRRAVGLALASATVAVLTTGCSLEDAICGGGEYPVMTVGSTGSACVPDGEDPPKGYVRYPEGKVPEHVDDKWDTYWRTHSVDRNGRIIEVPAASEQ
ncbi:SCO0607 family lipoprotein [Streptomyces sp. NPDC097727]|uniref:SCO0607 family lipoprotein n=1 Tax=Streptomyces sp. NPDC097727 TaxID=3366092 RepID=UPI00381CD71F